MLCKIKPIVTLCEKDNKILMFAAKELQKYLKMVICEEIPVMATNEYTPCEKVIYLGTDLTSLPDVADKNYDDAIGIQVENFAGFITGTNARSVLIGVYRFLREKDYKFIRPGKDGEVIPESVTGSRVYVLEKASYRHRGMCMEGGMFQEEFADVIDWLPKVSMNEYFVQFKIPRTFFDRWYASNNPYTETKQLTTEEIMNILSDAEEDMNLRGILYHGVGHGWTSSAFGMEGSSFDATDEIPTEEQKSIMAQVNGVRDLWYKVPLNTNLCYSREDVRTSVADDIVNYCAEHPNVDYLHFWLADGCNNHCECENCRDTRPSDYYVMMLNDIDKKLTEKGLKTKIVFLLYYDLLWKPLTEKFKNSDRFTLMFAPIRRSYSSSYDACAKGVMTEFNRNKLIWPKSIGDCLEYLRDWQKFFEGDSFVFDYHFMWDHYYELPQYRHAQVLHGDIKALCDIGINGFINCQVHRVFTPTSLGMNILAETLWNKEISFDAVCENVLKTEFGAKWEKVRDYLSTLSGLSVAIAVRNEETYTNAHTENLIKSKEIIKAFAAEFEPELKGQLCENWAKLMFFGEVYDKIIDYIIACGDEKEEQTLNAVVDFVYKNEYRFRDVFDGSYFVLTLKGSYAERIKIAKGLKKAED